MTLIPHTRLGDFAKDVSRRAASDTDLPVYSVTKHHGFVPSLEYFKKQVFSRDTKGYKKVMVGELAYATIHLDEGSIGVCPQDSLISPMYTVFSVDESRANPKYVERYLKSPKALSVYPSLGKGSVHRRASISFNRLAELPIPLPSLPEQRRIIEILDRADALRIKRRGAIAKLNQLLQSIFLEMFGDPLTNLKGWPRYKLEELIKFTGGSQPPKETFSEIPKPGFVRLVQIRDFKSDKFATYIPEKLARRNFTKEDVMIGRYGPPVFQILRGLEGSYNVALMKAEPKEKIINEYLFHLLRTDSIQKSVIESSQRSAGQSGVNLEFLHNIEIGVPPIQLQEKFSYIAKSLVAQRRKYMASEEGKDMFFDAIQIRAFSGVL